MALLITPQYVGVGTLNAHIRRALEFTARDDIYVAFGKTAPWVDDNLPPEPDPLSSEVLEVAGYKKVNKLSLVVPDVNGPYELYGLMWREVLPEDAYVEQARHVWVQAQLKYDEFDTSVVYRQIGIYTGLVRDPVDLADNPGRVALLPAHVQSAGVLEYIYNDKPIPRAANRRDIINVILTF